MRLALFGIVNCDTVRKARRWLDEHGIEYAFYDYKKAGIDEARLMRWIDEAGSFEAWDEAQRARHRAGERPSPAWSYAQRVLGAREELASRLGLLDVD